MDDRPLGSYAGFAIAFTLALGGFGAAERGRLLTGLATHKLARMITKDDVTTFVRAPFTTDEQASEPRRRGLRRALGELVTCPDLLHATFARVKSS
jgi:hypothetical protein